MDKQRRHEGLMLHTPSCESVKIIKVSYSHFWLACRSILGRILRYVQQSSGILRENWLSQKLMETIEETIEE